MLRHVTAVIRADAPHGSLLAAAAGRAGGHIDACRTEIAAEADLAALFTTPLFRAERAILALAGFPSRAADASALAKCAQSRFAVWRVDARRPSEILLRDVSDPIGSWFLVEAARPGTRSWFGSVILPSAGFAPARPGLALWLLLGPHRAYSRALLATVAARLDRP